MLSPNADEALSLLSITSPPTRSLIQESARKLLDYGVRDAVIIRSGAMGAFVLVRGSPKAWWVPAFWSSDDPEAEGKVIDVTGAGNAFLGGLSAGWELAAGVSGAEIVLEAALHASVSASFTIEQYGLPTLDEGARFARVGMGETWNGDVPLRRLKLLKERVETVDV